MDCDIYADVNYIFYHSTTTTYGTKGNNAKNKEKERCENYDK